MPKIISTPAERFNNLPGYNFSENFIEVTQGLKMHYVDEGKKADPIVLLLHGEPTWSYLYRKMIPILVENNFRVIAPDLIGFGKSDKYTEKSDYSYQNHMDWLTSFVTQLDLKNITLFCQDWGGLLGLRLIAEMPERFSHVIASNTTLPTGEFAVPESFMPWREFSQHSEAFNIGKVVDMGCVSQLSEEVIAAYNAPFPTEEYKAGARIFPTLVPIEENDLEAINNREAWKKLIQWNKPFLTIFGDSDPIMLGAEKALQKFIPGAKGQKHAIINAGHFIQEDQGEELARKIVEFRKD